MEIRGKRHLPAWMLKGSVQEGSGHEGDQLPSRISREEVAAKEIGREIVPGRSAEDLGFSDRKPKRRRTSSDQARGDAKLTVDDLVSIAEEIVNSGEERERTPTEKPASRSESESGAPARERVETGGEARDMLDVFLGPLLRKTMGEKKSEINLVVENDGGGSGLVLPGKRDTVGLERETVKRKSSLRDRVSLYLD